MAKKIGKRRNMQDSSKLILSIKKRIYRIKLQKIGSFSLIERVILSAGAMLIFSVSFPVKVLVYGIGGVEWSSLQIDQMSEDEVICAKLKYIPLF
jgi:hypothetical protein